MKTKKKYSKPKIIIKEFVITDIISSSFGVDDGIGGNEYRY